MSATKVIPIPVAGRRSITTYLLLGKRPVLVDSGTPGTAGKIREGIARQGVDPTDVSLIVLTHAHLDHFGSAAELRKITGAKVAGHVADAGPYRAGDSRRPYLPMGPLGRLMIRSRIMDVEPQPVDPDILLDGEMSLDEYGIAARVLPTPGHTAGSVSVLTDAGDLVAGDLVATSFFGLLPGKPANPPFHDDPLANLASLRRMLELGPAALHVGHGGRLDPQRVARWADREERRLRRLDARGRLVRRPPDDHPADAA